jgi:REase_AHJR-like
MIVSTVVNPEKERIIKIAAEYSKKGYEVMIGPQKEDLPSFLHPYQPAIIARQGNHNIIVEIASRHSPQFQQYLPSLTKEIEQHSDWQLDLVMTKSEESSDSFHSSEPLSLLEIQRRLQITKGMIAQPLESVLIYAWSLGEAALRLLAQQENIVLKNNAPINLVNQLVVEGAISRAEYQCLIDSLPLRNAAAHGFQINNLTWESIEQLIVTIEQLLAYVTSPE